MSEQLIIDSFGDAKFYELIEVQHKKNANCYGKSSFYFYRSFKLRCYRQSTGVPIFMQTDFLERHVFLEIITFSSPKMMGIKGTNTLKVTIKNSFH